MSNINTIATHVAQINADLSKLVNADVAGGREPA